MKRWINVGWSQDSWVKDDTGNYTRTGEYEAVMNLNGRPRAYYSLDQARKARPQLSRDTRTVELDFTEEGISARWVE